MPEPRNVRLRKSQAKTLATFSDGQPHEITPDNRRDVRMLHRLRLVSLPKPPPWPRSHRAERHPAGGQQADVVKEAPAATITKAGKAYLKAQPAQPAEPPQTEPAQPAEPAPAEPAQPNG